MVRPGQAMWKKLQKVLRNIPFFNWICTTADVAKPFSLASLATEKSATFVSFKMSLHK